MPTVWLNVDPSGTQPSQTKVMAVMGGVIDLVPLRPPAPSYHADPQRLGAAPAARSF
jgi:hypothetical protein